MTVDPLSLSDEELTLGRLEDPIMRALDQFWGYALDTSNSRDFRIFAEDEPHVDGGGVLDEDEYIRVKAIRMRNAYRTVTAERDRLRAQLQAVRELHKQADPMIHWCIHDEHPWPCNTIQAIGEEA